MEKSASKYSIEARYASNLLIGKATTQGGGVGLSLLSITITYKFLLACYRGEKLKGLIYMDEMEPGEVTELIRPS